MRVLHVATEAFPYVKVGGLSDVVGALPGALSASGVDARILLPGYPSVLELAAGLTETRRLEWLPGAGTARVLAGRTERGVPLYVLDIPERFARSRDPYADFGDSHLGAAALSRAAVELAREGDGTGWKPQILHCHDWQTALAPAYMRFAGPHLPSVMTIHNLGHQGIYGPEHFGELGLPPEAFRPEGLEFWGRVNLLKSGLVYAWRLTTVSPTYAREIQTPEGGQGLDGVLRSRSAHLSGILNGIDEAVWDPARSPHVTSPYDRARLALRAPNKPALQRASGLAEETHTPLFGVVSRLAHQKGLDLLVDNVEHLVGLGAQLIVVGKGDRALEYAFAEAARRHPGRVALRIEQNEGLAHQVFAAADFVVVPSRSEPCGLVQMYAMRYGAVPVVRHTGGLADTVRDETTGGGATGFTFDPPEGFALGNAITRAVLVFHDRPERHRELQAEGMSRDFGWAAAAKRYVDLYRDVLR